MSYSKYRSVRQFQVPQFLQYGVLVKADMFRILSQSAGTAEAKQIKVSSYTDWVNLIYVSIILAVLKNSSITIALGEFKLIYSIVPFPKR